MKVYRGNCRKPLKQKLPNAGTKRKAQHKRKYKCENGPLKGESLYLTDGVSAVFTINNNKGFYDQGMFIPCK